MTLLGWTNIATAGLLALALAFGFYERSGWEAEIAARAQDTIKAEEALRKRQSDDAIVTKGLSDQLAAEQATSREQANARTVAIARAPATQDCVNSPAMRALFDGLRQRPGAAAAGRPPDPGRAGAAVP